MNETTRNILKAWLNGDTVTIKGKVYVFPHGLKHIKELLKL